jgi:hypothetical protein
MKNIDIMFIGVEYIEVPRHLPKLRLEDATDDDFNYIRERLPNNNYITINDITIINSMGNRYYVVGKPKIQENDLDLFEPPFEKLNHFY